MLGHRETGPSVLPKQGEASEQGATGSGYLEALAQEGMGG